MLRDALQALGRTIIRMFAFSTKEIRMILHQPRLVLTLIVGPFLLLLLFGIGYRNSPRSLNTLFVVPEGSPIENYVREYAQSLGDRIQFAGIVHDADLADTRLRTGAVELVVVTPADPMADWQQNEQSVFTLYHSEISPIEQTYIRVVGQRYAEVINREVLSMALTTGQEEAQAWDEDVSEARDVAGSVRSAIAAGNEAQDAGSGATPQDEVNPLALTLANALSILSTVEEPAGSADAAGAATAPEENILQEGEARAAEVEESLSTVDTLLTEFQTVDTEVLVAPFRTETLSVSPIQVDPMHFYVPAVVALLLQHLAITLAGLSITQEKRQGAMELFRAAPVSAFEMLVGKYGSYLVLIGGLAAVLTALLVLVLRVPQAGAWANYVLIILVTLLAALGAGFNISLSARSDSQAIQYGMLTLLAAIFFSGLFLPLYQIAAPVRIVSWLIPATYSTAMLQDQMLRGQSPQLLLLGALVGLAAVLFLLAWWRLSRQMGATRYSRSAPAAASSSPVTP